MQVRMPDGTIVTNVPENITKAQLLAKYQGTPEVPEGPQSFVEALTDPGAFDPGVEQRIATLPEAGKFLLEHAPEIAATGASLAFPALAAPAALARLGPLAARIAGPIIRNLPRIGATGAAGGAGGVVKESFDPEATLDSTIKAGIRSTLEMGGAEAAGLGVTGVLSKTLAPGAKTLTEEGKKLIDFARQHNIPLKPSAAAPSTTAKTVEGAVESFLPGRVFKQFANKKIANVLATNTPDANKLISEVAQVYNKNSPGLDRTIRSARKAVQVGLEEWTPKVEARYAKFTQAIGGKDRWTDYPKLRAVMETIRDEQKALAGGADEATLKFIRDFRKKYSGQVNADDLYKQYKRLGHIKGADKRHLGLIRDAFKEEFDDLAAATGENAKQLLGDANKEYILGKRYFKGDPVIKKIASGDLDDARVTVELFRDSKYSTLKQLEANIPKENFLNLQRLNLENLINNSSVRPPDNPFVSILDGNKLLRWIEKNPKTVGLYPKETQEALRNLGLYAKLHGKEAIAGTKDFVSAVQSSALKTGAAGVALNMVGADPSGIGLIITSGTAPAVAWSMMRPNSAINKWLVRGEIGPFAKGVNEGLKVGGRIVFSGALEE